MHRRFRAGLSAAMAALLVLTLVLAACGDGDDDDNATPGATTAPAAPTATATEPEPPAATPTTDAGSAEGTQATSPTAAASPTSSGTAPSRPIVTATPAPTETPDGSAVTVDEAELMAALIQQEDLGTDWVQETFGPMEPDTDDGDELCGVPPFPERDERVAGVEAEYALEGEEPAFVLHNIVRIPEDVATDAMQYARDASNCGTWTDEDGVEYTITPLTEPDLGDEAFSAALTFELDGMPIYAEYTFIRVGDLIATIAFVTLDGTDISPYLGLVDVAVSRLEAVAGVENGSGDAPLEETLAALLLQPEDIELVDSVNVWSFDDELDIDDDERYPICGAQPFADALGAVAEVGHSLYADQDNGPFALHALVQMDEDTGPATMDWIRGEMSCERWEDEDGEYIVAETGDLSVGDDTYWLIVALTNAETGDVAQVGFAFTQLGDVISVVGLAQIGDLDAQLFGATIAIAAEKVLAGMNP